MTVIKSIVVCLALANIGYFLYTNGIAASRAVPTPKTPPSTLKLASEAPSAAPGPLPALAEGGVPSAATGDDSTSDLTTNVHRCLSVGPFRDVAEAAHAATTLRSSGHDPRQRVVDGEVWAGVWVYLPLPVNRAAGDQLLSKLKAGGIDDAMEMPGPTEGSVVSLGLFSEQKRAQARITQAQALGLNPATADRKRSGNVYWIDMDLKPTDGLLNPIELQGEAGRITRLEVKTCPPIAATPP